MAAIPVNQDNMIAITLPRGTELCPIHRLNGQNEYYVVLEEDAVCRVASGFRVSIDCMQVALVNNDDNIEQLFAPNNAVVNSIRVPVATPYHISDNVRDPIGLPKRLEHQTEFAARPGNRLQLAAHTLVVTCGSRKKISLAEPHNVTL